MFEILKSYLKKESFYIVLLKSGLYIKNYTKLIGINEEELLIEINQVLYKIKGKDMILTKTVGQELAIKGSIESIITL